ncbi:Cob(II)yrinic acid a,c-diamide reductase [Fragilariopsis cylindrus CCMP1102]|uniref:Cob(II)yrinic acid a,c-diamide reductase n=1 Tax=Fragilariopsis cylindrus CCMP1102 TaxID=635003 RepID=A0A1E7FQ50_9STRA|nr:Cob(II)yrinic acid a,c-diamide reductase [Fragilariopsis cylindrus CCMP1102]|eukprot:OEU20278.1 Cob(II)yrinic acid a,c-diamide reductase [Fragilariopsis cylindrus CCMP1102]
MTPSRSSSYNSIPACIRERQPTTTSMLMTTSDKNAAAATAAAATTTTADVNNNNKNNDTDNDDKTKKKQNKTKKKQNKTKKTQKGDDDGKENGIFTKSFYKEFNELLKYRRDVRRFYTNDRKPVSEKLIYQLLNTAFTTSPSVGLSEPWKILHVKSQIAKTNVINNFEKCNQDALQGYNSSNNDEGGSSTTTTNSKAELYSKLKLSGLQDAPIHIAIYCNDATTKGSGLGIQTMPEMKQYSCVCGIMSFWLLARSKGIGCGWVSILDPKQLIIDLNLKEDDDWTLIGYLCVGYPNLDDDNDDDIKDNDIKDNYDDDSVVDGTSGIISRSKRSSTPELELYGICYVKAVLELTDFETSSQSLVSSIKFSLTVVNTLLTSIEAYYMSNCNAMRYERCKNVAENNDSEE